MFCRSSNHHHSGARTFSPWIRAGSVRYTRSMAKWLCDSYSCSIHWVRKCRSRPLLGQNNLRARSVVGNSLHGQFSHLWLIDISLLVLINQLDLAIVPHNRIKMALKSYLAKAASSSKPKSTSSASAAKIKQELLGRKPGLLLCLPV